MTISGFGRVFNSNALPMRALRPLYWGLALLAGIASRKVLFQNRGDQQFFETKLPRLRRRCAYIGSGVEMDVSSTQEFSGRLRVLLVARLLPTKGIDDFLAVAAALHDRCTFRLIGPASSGHDELLQRVRAAPGVQYLGELDSQATEQELRAAHVLFFPSYGEGMSRVMLEAGFAGVCPLAYDIAANLDLLAPGRGFIVTRGDRQAAIAVLQRLESERPLLASNAQAYQRFVVTNYSARAFAERLDAVMREVG